MRMGADLSNADLTVDALVGCGLDVAAGGAVVGDLFPGKIGISPGLYDRINGTGTAGGLFARHDFLRPR